LFFLLSYLAILHLHSFPTRRSSDLPLPICTEAPPLKQHGVRLLFRMEIKAPVPVAAVRRAVAAVYRLKIYLEWLFCHRAEIACDPANSLRFFPLQICRAASGFFLLCVPF